MSLIVELSPAEDSSHSSAEKHRVEENEAADSRVRVFAKYHESDKPNCWATEVKLAGGKVGQGDTDNTKQGIEGSHEGVVDFFGVCVSRLELERSIVSSENSRESDKHLTKGRVDVEVVLVLDVVATKFTKANDGG